MALRPHPEENRSGVKKIRSFLRIDDLCGHSLAGYGGMDRLRCGIHLRDKISILASGCSGRCPDRGYNCQYSNYLAAMVIKSVH